MTELVVRVIVATVRDVLPVAVIIIGFQVLVLRQPLRNPRRVAIGLVYVVLGLALFLLGLEEALFPIGRAMAEQLTAPGFVAPSGVESGSRYPTGSTTIGSTCSRSRSASRRLSPSRR